MAPKATDDSKKSAAKSLGHVLVTGGCGFLGDNIVSLLLSRSVTTKLSVLDVRPAADPKSGVEYHFGDITNYNAIQELFQKVKPDVVIHTASPHFNVRDQAIMYKVNVEGTRNLVRASQETGVKAFVYTSSASVLSDNTNDLIYANEEYPLVIGDGVQPLYYTTTKGLAEQHVLASNRPASHPKFLTCAIRPAGIMGEGDVQLIPRMMTAYYKGQTKFQLGDNTNLFDFTYVANISHAHHLAAAALLTTLEREGQEKTAPLGAEKVDGEAFLITNDQPVYFWDFARMVWKTCGDTTQPKDVWVLPKAFGLLIASIIEWIFWAFRLGTPNLTRDQVKFSCFARYYNIDKAKRRLGYRPTVGLEEGVRRAVAHAIKTGVVTGMPEHLKGSQGVDETKKDR